MKVKMNVHTGWEGKALSPGDVLDVDAIVAARWQKNGIAQMMDKPKKAEKTVITEDDNEPAAPTLRELKKLAKERGIEGYSTMAKQELAEALAQEENGV